MRYQYAAAMLAGVILTATSVQAQSPLVAVGNGATTPLCKKLAAIADSLSVGSGPSAIRAIPEAQLTAPFARIWQPAQASQLTPDLIRHIAADRYRPEAQRELDSQKPLGAPAAALPASRYDARAEEIGVAKLHAATSEGRLVVEYGPADLTGSGKTSTALHIGIKTDAQQAYHLIDWSVHVIPDASTSELIGLLRNEAVARYSDVVRYGGKDYVINGSMAARHVRLNPFGMATTCEGVARVADARKR